MPIRKAELKDLKKIKEIADTLYLDMPNFVWNQEDFIAQQIKKEEYFLLHQGDEVIGIISFKKRRNKISIETMAVKKAFTSNGFGTELIEFAKKFAKDGGFDILHSYSFYEYKIVDFYIKKGFILLKKPGSYNGHKYHCLEIKVD